LKEVDQRGAVVPDQCCTVVPDFPFPREYHGVYLGRRRECGFQLYETVGIARGDRVASARQGRENFRLFGAPHVCIVTTDEGLGLRRG
jgi:hypothetical protein